MQSQQLGSAASPAMQLSDTSTSEVSATEIELPGTKKPRKRINGIDLARAIAVFGMVMAHMGPIDGPALYQLSAGYPSALFAVLAGVSLSIMMSPAAAIGGEVLRIARHRILVRGVIILIFGVILTALQTPIDVVLSAIAAVFILLFDAPRLRSWALVIWLLVFTVLGGVVSVLSNYIYPGNILGGSYPLFAWLAYGIVGILVHRFLVLARWWVQVIVLVISGAAASWGAWLRVFEATVYPSIDDESAFEAKKEAAMSLVGSDSMDSGTDYVESIFSFYAHTGAVGDIFFSATMAVAVIAVCLLLCNRGFLNTVLYPLRAAGSMTLTLYVAHAISAIFIMGGGLGLGAPGGGVVFDSSDPDTAGGMPWAEYQRIVKENDTWEGMWQAESEYQVEHLSSDPSKELIEEDNHEKSAWISTLVGIIFASLWKISFKRGPLEWLVSWTIRRWTRGDSAPRRNDHKSVIT